jgi:TonB family protein
VQRIEGAVVVNVLVSETGEVQDLRLISGGTGRTALLGEAAMQAMRRSTFAPGMKDGVHVKSWATVRVDFKL